MNPTSPTPRRCWAEIDPDALRHNVRALRARVGEGVRVMAVVKANAYGHGLAETVRALAEEVEMFGVANVAEAREAQRQVSGGRIFILGPALPEERGEIVRKGFIPSVSDLAEARAYQRLARGYGGERVRVHLVVDTGMGRIGVWEEEAVALAREICAMPELEIRGIASHLPVADEDDDWTREQLARFHRLVPELRAAGIARSVIHVENSAGAIGFPAEAGDMIRAGLAIYGSAPRPDFQPQLRPALAWKTRVTLVRDVGAGRGISYGRTFITQKAMRVATLGVGYADGFRRHLSHHGAEVLIGGRRCPVLGRVTMDQTVVDVSALPEAQAGDEAVLIGRQGAEEILVAELAQKAGTIAWEILTGLGPRVERVWLGRDDGKADCGNPAPA